MTNLLFDLSQMVLCRFQNSYRLVKISRNNCESKTPVKNVMSKTNEKFLVSRWTQLLSYFFLLYLLHVLLRLLFLLTSLFIYVSMKTIHKNISSFTYFLPSYCNKFIDSVNPISLKFFIHSNKCILLGLCRPTMSISDLFNKINYKKIHRSDLWLKTVNYCRRITI